MYRKLNLIKNLFFGFILFNLWACNKNSKSGNSDLENLKVYNLTAEEVLQDKKNIYKVSIVDSLLLIKNFAGYNEPAFSIFENHLGNFKHLLDFGTIGDGPNEFEEQVYYTQQYYSSKDLMIWVFENNRNKYSLVNLSKTIETGATVIEKVINIKPGNSYFDIFFINDSTIIGNNDNLAIKMKHLLFYNPISQNFTKTVSFNQILENPNPNDIDFTQQQFNPIYMNTLRLNTEGSKLVSSMASQDIIKIFDVNGELVKTINNSKESISDVSKYIRDANQKVFNLDCVLTDNFIYTLYSGSSFSDLYENNSPTSFKIYDWNYDLKYQLNTENSCHFLAVDEKNGFILGTSLTQEKVFRFNIKNIMVNDL